MELKKGKENKYQVRWCKSRIFNALLYSLQGIGYAIKNERAFRQELVCFVFLSIMLFLVPFAFIWKVFIFIFQIIVLVAELFNTSVETICDKISKESDNFIKIAKDTSSAGVFLTIIIVLVLWIAAFWDYFLSIK